jgi:hypothetical protein
MLQRTSAGLNRRFRSGTDRVLEMKPTKGVAMTTEILLDESIRELDHRAGDGVDVFLLWNAAADRIVVAVSDARTGEAFDLTVQADQALDAFHHPFAYAAAAGVAFSSPARESACAETTTVL